MFYTKNTNLLGIQELDRVDSTDLSGIADKLGFVFPPEYLAFVEKFGLLHFAQYYEECDEPDHKWIEEMRG